MIWNKALKASIPEDIRVRKDTLQLPSFVFNNRLASNLDGLRRAPNSFYDQRYYTGLILGFKAFDGIECYARFRLIPADGSMETGLLSEHDQRNVW